MDKELIAEGVKKILKGLGEDLNREGLKGTPERVAKMYKEIFTGMDQDPAEAVEVTYGENHDEMILVSNIPLYSVCEHHLLPFFGRAHVAYIPGDNGRVAGISKIARLVDLAARRLQLQERLTTTIADRLTSAVGPQGVIVVVEAEHLCMSMRGVQKPGAITVTSAVRGIFRANESTRAEAMALIRDRKG